MNVANQIAKFHAASRQFKVDHPKEWADMQRHSDVWNGMFKHIELNIPKEDEFYGIMHGDMHEGNFLVDPNNNNKLTFFDWDLLSKGWYAIDIGCVIFGCRFGTLMMQKSREESNEMVKGFCQAFLAGYSPDKPIDMEHIKEGCRFRVELIHVAFKMIVDEGHNENFKPFADQFYEMVEKDLFNFDFLT